VLIDLSHFDFRGLRAVHVGAGLGAEASWYHTKGFSQVLWVEGNKRLRYPLAQRLASFPNQRYVIAICSEKTAPIDLYIANNIASSSILPLKEHKEIFPGIHYIGKQFSKSTTLDDIVQNKSFDFINIDVQGAELLVLRGAKKLLGQVKYIYLEINITELYEGCALLPEITSFLDEYHFTLDEIALYEGSKWGEALYVKQMSLL